MSRNSFTDLTPSRFLWTAELSCDGEQSWAELMVIEDTRVDPGAVRIRAAAPADAEAVCALHVRSIRGLGARAYDPAQIAAWAGGRQPTDYLTPIASTCFLVAETAGLIEGFAMLDPERGDLHALYVDPPSACSGVGSALLQVTFSANRTSSSSNARL